MTPMRRMERPLKQSILPRIPRIPSSDRNIPRTAISLHHRPSKRQTGHPTVRQPALQDRTHVVVVFAGAVAGPGGGRVAGRLAVEFVERVPVEVVEPGGVVVDASEDAAGVGFFDTGFAEAVAVEEGGNARGGTYVSKGDSMVVKDDVLNEFDIRIVRSFYSGSDGIVHLLDEVVDLGPDIFRQERSTLVIFVVSEGRCVALVGINVEEVWIAMKYVSRFRNT